MTSDISFNNELSASKRKIFSIELTPNGKEKVKFNLSEIISFLEESGFRMLKVENDGITKFQYIRIVNGIIYYTHEDEILRFLFDYIIQIKL